MQVARLKTRIYLFIYKKVHKHLLKHYQSRIKRYKRCRFEHYPISCPFVREIRSERLAIETSVLNLCMKAINLINSLGRILSTSNGNLSKDILKTISYYSASEIKGFSYM